MALRSTVSNRSTFGLEILATSGSCLSRAGANVQLKVPLIAARLARATHLRTVAPADQHLDGTWSTAVRKTWGAA